MIVQPEFLEHWKTRYLIDLLDDPCAPLYVIRLWGHCQTSKTHGFPRKNPSVLKAICKAPQDAESFENSMIEAGFVDLVKDGKGDMWMVHDWDEVNASLIANWKNGSKGGRPKKKGRQKPMGSARDILSETHQKPIREDKIREDKKEPPKPPKGVEEEDDRWRLLVRVWGTGKISFERFPWESWFTVLRGVPEFDCGKHADALVAELVGMEGKTIGNPSSWFTAAMRRVLEGPRRFGGVKESGVGSVDMAALGFAGI